MTAIPRAHAHTRTIFFFSRLPPYKGGDGKIKILRTRGKKYILTFTDDFTKNLEGSRYKYNIMYFVGDERYPQCANSDIVVDGVINSYEGN